MKKNGERQLDGQGFRLRAAGLCTRRQGSRMQILLVSGTKVVLPLKCLVLTSSQ